MMAGKVKNWLCARRGRLAALAAGVLALGVFYAVRGNRAWMDAWLAGVSMPVKRGLSALVDPLPFSACELGATVLIVGALALLGRAVLRTARGHAAALADWALGMALLLVWGYAAVCALWGTQYYGTSFAQRAGMSAPAMSVEQLAAVTQYFAAQVAATADAVPRLTDTDAAAQITTSKRDILENTAGLYDAVSARYPFLAGPQRTPKPALYSKLMSAWGFTGYLCPLLGESTLNVDCPTVFLPVTVAHEQAHQRGVAAEQEANFVGVLAAVTSGDALYEYSGWLFGYLHLSNALYGANAELGRASYAALPVVAQADLAANNAYWAKWEGPVQQTGEKVYTAFLRGYGQELGMQSYGACVDLLVEEFLPYTTCSAPAAG